MWITPPIALDQLPREPGVYRMLDARRKVLYVGKARNLRKRVSSYFQRRPDAPRIEAMVRQVRDVEFTITASEAEALVLEHNLIKQLKPRYNVLLKDAKSYPYILLTDERFPRLRLYRGPRKQPGTYFGPYPNAGAVHRTLDLMQKIFRLRDCEDAVFSNRSRPCMQHQIGRCTAPCVGLVDEARYREQVEAARAFLEGRDTDLLARWEREMMEAAEARAFERAAELRDRIRTLRAILAQAGSDLPPDCDGYVVLRDGRKVAVAIGMRRAGRDLGTHLVRAGQAGDATDREVLETLFVDRYRQDPPPPLILFDAEAEEADLARLMRLLGARRAQARRPRRGTARDWLADIRRNGIRNFAHRAGLDQAEALEALGELLGLKQRPELVACVDNAHLGGRHTVAGIVYADSSGPRKDLYRHYRLDEVPEGDDYAAMRAVLDRFFRSIAEGELPRPDVMLIDGGRGQLAEAVHAAAAHGVSTFLVGVAKGSRRRFGEESLWIAGRDRPLKPGARSGAMMLIGRVRDEAHRFAGRYLRKRRSRQTLSSSLEAIPGVGPARRTALLRHFGGIEGVRQASREQLAEAPGISEALAERIFAALHR